MEDLVLVGACPPVTASSVPVLASILAQTTTTPVRVVVEKHTDSTGLVGLLIGAGLVVLGQLLAHRYTALREQRKERADAVDRTAAALVDFDRHVAHFRAWVGTGRSPSEIQQAADEVTGAEMALRQASFSLRIRLPASHVIPDLFAAAEGLYTASYLALEPTMIQGDRSALGASFHYFAMAREARVGAEAAARDFFRYGPLSMALRGRFGYHDVRRTQAWRPMSRSPAAYAAKALYESTRYDEDGWIPFARVQGHARKLGAADEVDVAAGLVELKDRRWAETDEDNRWRATGLAFAAGSEDAI